MHRNKGQSLVEFLVVAMFALVPLWLAIQAMGKFIDVQHTAHMAARYAAWERTVWFEDTSSDFYAHNQPNQKNAAEIRNEIAVRIFNDRDPTKQVIAATDKSATSFSKGLDPLWVDSAGTAYLSKYDQAKNANTFGTLSSDVAGKALAAISAIKVPYVTGSLVPPVPSNNTLALATVEFDKVATSSEVYKRLWSKKAGLPVDWEGLSFSSQAAILTNTWAANSSSGVSAMTKASIPTASGLGSALDKVVTGGLLLWDPTLAGRTPELGKVAPDVVPADRLK